MNISDIGSTSFTNEQIRNLQKSGVDEKTAVQLGFRNITSIDEATELLRYKPHSSNVPGLAIPYYPGGDKDKEPLFWRIRPDKPESVDGQKPARYLQPKGISPQIYIPPSLWIKAYTDQTSPLIITEGEKKAIIAAMYGIAAIAGTGVWGFHNPKESKDQKKHVPSISLRKMIQPGRVCYIAFDSKKFEKPSVLRAEVALAEMLRDMGAEVRIVHIPGDEKNPDKDIGLDDFIVSNGPDAFRKLIHEAWSYPVSDFAEEFESPQTNKDKGIALQRFASYLAFMKPGTIDPVIKTLYKKLDCKRSTLIGRIEEFSVRLLNQSEEDGIDTDLKEELESIRTEQKSHPLCKGKRPFLVISELIEKDIQQHGYFINDNDNIWVFDKGSANLLPFEVEKPIRRMLLDKYGVNSSTSEFPFVMNQLDLVGSRKGLKVKVNKMSFYDSRNNVLYLYNGDQCVYKITELGHQQIRNGDDSVFFSNMDEYEPFKFDANCDENIFSEYFSAYNYDGRGMTKDDYVYFIWVYIIYTIFYREMIPILHIKGGQNSGKSFSAKGLLKILIGHMADVSQDIKSPSDLKAAICAKLHLGIDNVEEMANDCIDTLCTTVTGGKVEKRELFTTNDMYSFRPQCAIIITSRTDEFMAKRPDLSTRALPIQLQPFEKGAGDLLSEDFVKKLRTSFWSNFLRGAPELLQRLRANKSFGSEFKTRLSGFFSFGAKISNDLESWQACEDYMEKCQAGASISERLWFKALQVLMEKYPERREELAEPQTASFYRCYLDEMCRIHLGCPDGLDLEAPWLGRYFKEQAQFINKFFDFRLHESPSGDRNLYSIKLKAAGGSMPDPRISKRSIGAFFNTSNKKNKLFDDNSDNFILLKDTTFFPPTPAGEGEKKVDDTSIDFSEVRVNPRKARSLVRHLPIHDDDVI